MKRYDLPPVTGMDAQTGLLLAMLESATREWQEMLGEVSEEELCWQPFPGGHSIGALILHIADVEAHWLYEVGAGKTRPAEERKTLLSEETDQGAVQWPTPPARPFAWFLE